MFNIKKPSDFRAGNFSMLLLLMSLYTFLYHPFNLLPTLIDIHLRRRLQCNLPFHLLFRIYSRLDYLSMTPERLL